MPLAVGAVQAVSELTFGLFAVACLVAAATVAFGLKLVWTANRRSEWVSRSLQSLTDAASDPLVICRAGEIVSVNDSFRRLSGLEPSALSGASLEDLISAGDRSALRDQIAHPDTAASHALLRTRLIRPDGVKPHVELAVNLIEGDPAKRVVVSVKDLREKIATAQKLRHMSEHDPLTGLATRDAFETRLAELIDRMGSSDLGDDPRLALHLIDVNRLTEVNESVGRCAGDEVLLHTGRILRHVRGRGDLIARLGGDVFALAQVNLAEQSRQGEGAASAKARDLCNRLSGPLVVAGEAVNVSVSVGFAVYPRDGSTIDALMKAASFALAKAKAEGRGQCHAYEPALAEGRLRRRRLERELRQALALGEDLSLAYQPQIRLHGEPLCGFEALARWRHPEFGDVPPSEFIPIAEEAGFVAEIDAWALNAACAEAVHWPAVISLAVNLSALSVVDAGLPSRVQSILERTGLAPQRLEVEVTETALIRDFDRAQYVLGSLKALGCRIAMDDFGTGYSSLYYLQAFPFDKIKIDRSFITELESRAQSRAIVRAVAGLANGLDLPVLAEGVETPEQLALLARKGCHEAQGFLIGRPMRAEDARALIERSVSPTLAIAQSAAGSSR